MYSRMLVLRFPKTEVEKPIVCYLASDFDLTFNILKATILPRKEGVMVLELSGRRKDFNKGVQYLKERGVQVQAVGQDIKRNTIKCTHCGACTAVCPTGALSIERPEMTVVFNHKKCSVCELCVPACPPRAMEIRTTGNTILK
ncbi:MAG: 4Fe-4S dicluster domain-containing protein [Deltaproteobacteria bacterium]|nr:4Fe-4S dicluster domain-containing protein [Deltaproteobacteria bacterium]MBW1796154.1 4Fe-4S dicluster domain-containing protein [Deltaproteobacteria bacterium]MBW2331565.1 4Fe-4S dicluster domain-containing protein [Deltaproteobacteria bacterium]